MSGRLHGAVSEADVVARGEDVPLLWGFGAGVNTWAVMAGLKARGIAPDLTTFADTGGEGDETYAANRRAQEVIKSLGWRWLITVRKTSPQTGDRTLEEECLRRETMPSRAFGLSSCAMRWKVEPQDKFLNSWPAVLDCWAAGKKPIKILGYDGGEERRADITEDKRLRYWYPLIEWGWDRDRCIAEIKAQGWEVPPKSACFFCPSSTKTEVIQLSRQRPDLFARAVTMEQAALTSDRHNLRSIKGLGRHWSWEELVAMSPEDQAAQPEAPVEACVTCTDEACP